MNISPQIELTLHTLRRAFATYHAEAGLPLPLLSKLLGHKSVRTTALYWMNIYNEDDDDTNNILTGKFWLEKPKKPSLEPTAPAKMSLELPEPLVSNLLVNKPPLNYLTKIQQLEEQLSQIQQENSSLKKQNTHLQQDLDHLNQQKAYETKQQEQVQQELTEAKQIINQLEQKLTTAKNNLIREEQISHNLRQQLQTEQETNANLIAKLSSQEQNIASIFYYAINKPDITNIIHALPPHQLLDRKDNNNHH